MRRFIVTSGVVLFIVYFGFGLTLWLNQKSILYHPNAQDFYNCPGFEKYEKLEFNQTRFYYLPNSSEKVVVIYHGNAGSACDRAIFAPTFEQLNASILFVEYTGYSNDNISPSKQRLLKNAQDIASFVEQEKYSSVSVYGHSLGSGIAAYHASLGSVDNLVLSATFTSFLDMVKNRYPFYPVQLMFTENYQTDEYLSNYANRVTLIHGDQDTIIPAKYSQNLYEQINAQKDYHLLEGFGHNDLWNSSEYSQLVLTGLNSSPDN